MLSFIYAIGTLGGVGLCFGVGLATAYRFLAVEVNLKEIQILDALPGANCGACGFPGCSGYAAAIVAGEGEPNKCIPGGVVVVQVLGEILGIKIEVGSKKVARLLCKGGGCQAPKKFIYEGVEDCQMAVLVRDGEKKCQYACLGLGTCVRVCNFDALSMNNESGIPIVDYEKCVACGACAKECPKALFELCDHEKRVNILCSSNAVKGIEVRKACPVGCIKCRKCIKVCPVEAPYFVDNIIRIDTDKCTNCGLCVKNCPLKVIETV